MISSRPFSTVSVSPSATATTFPVIVSAHAVLNINMEMVVATEAIAARFRFLFIFSPSAAHVTDLAGYFATGNSSDCVVYRGERFSGRMVQRLAMPAASVRNVPLLHYCEIPSTTCISQE
ncbi:MAG TPA: hypothetical protein PK347_02795 [Burkholderiaceae bacterium]|nr:hypothetical protein [Burkholderiaceae bacterium]